MATYWPIQGFCRPPGVGPFAATRERQASRGRKSRPAPRRFNRRNALVARGGLWYLRRDQEGDHHERNQRDDYRQQVLRFAADYPEAFVAFLATIGRSQDVVVALFLGVKRRPTNLPTSALRASSEHGPPVWNSGRRRVAPLVTDVPFCDTIRVTPLPPRERTMAACEPIIVPTHSTPLPILPTISVRSHTDRANAEREAFSWYGGEAPSPMEAAYHFAEQVERDPANQSLYSEALAIFLATCWNIHPQQQRPA